MDVDFWPSQDHSSKHLSVVRAARLNSGTKFNLLLLSSDVSLLFGDVLFYVLRKVHFFFCYFHIALFFWLFLASKSFCESFQELGFQDFEKILLGLCVLIFVLDLRTLVFSGYC